MDSSKQLHRIKILGNAKATPDGLCDVSAGMPAPHNWVNFKEELSVPNLELVERFAPEKWLGDDPASFSEGLFFRGYVSFREGMSIYINK